MFGGFANSYSARIYLVICISYVKYSNIVRFFFSHYKLIYFISLNLILTDLPFLVTMFCWNKGTYQHVCRLVCFSLLISFPFFFASFSPIKINYFLSFEKFPFPFFLALFFTINEVITSERSERSSY